MNEIEPRASLAKTNAAMNNPLIKKAREGSRKSPTCDNEGLQQDAGTAPHRETSQKAKSVDHSPSKRPSRRRWPPAARSSPEGPGRRQPEKPKLDGAPQSQPRQDAEEGDSVQVVDGAVIARETAIVDREVPESSSAYGVAGAKAQEAGVPRRS